MLTPDVFLRILPQATGQTLNVAQVQAVAAHSHTPLFIVAGRGTGKTAVLTLRILRAIFVDSIPPCGIPATTSTCRAAQEIRSRLMLRGSAILRHSSLPHIDLSQVHPGTLDSFCEQFLRDHRVPGGHPPLLADPFLSSMLLMRSFTTSRAHRDPHLTAFLCNLRGSSKDPTTAELLDVIQAFADRRQHDLINWPQFMAATCENSSQHSKKTSSLSSCLFPHRQPHSHFRSSLWTNTRTPICFRNRFFSAGSNHSLNAYCGRRRRPKSLPFPRGHGGSFQRLSTATFCYSRNTSPPDLSLRKLSVYGRHYSVCQSV